MSDAVTTPLVGGGEENTEELSANDVITASSHTILERTSLQLLMCFNPNLWSFTLSNRAVN
jgi:hypothetical protein